MKKKNRKSNEWNVKIGSLLFSLFILFSLRPSPDPAEATSFHKDKGSIRMVSKNETDASAKFCDAIHAILESGQDKFKSIRGKMDLVSEEFFGKLVLPGLKECFGWLDGKAYHCRTDAGLSPEEVAEVYERYNRSLAECLPDHWQAKEKNVDRVNAKRFMTYKSASNPLTIRVGERNKRLGWYVDFYFKR